MKRLSIAQQAALEYRAERDRKNQHAKSESLSRSANAPHNTNDDAAVFAAPKKSVTLTSASSLKPSRIEWLWPGWLARGKLHILAGQPGAGKTTIAMLAAAIVSAGGRWPDGSLSPAGNVVIWTGEDDPADTLLPRLKASGADLSRVHFVTSAQEGGSSRPFDPSRDVPELTAAIEKIGGCALLIVDPIVNAVTGDSHKNTETRRALQPLVDLASASRAALIGITHLSKGSQGREPIERVTGSLAFGALARVVMVAGKAADGGGHDKRRFLARAKSNIGLDDGGFAYELQQIPMPGDGSIVASVAVFGEAIAGTARTMLADAEATHDTIEDDDASLLGEAKAFLADFLANGPQSAKAVTAAARDAMISTTTLRRAKTALGVTAKKGGMADGWRWTLPDSEPTAHSSNLKNPEAVPTSPKAGEIDGAPPEKLEGGQHAYEDVHPKSVSIFANADHLRDDDGGVEI